jgi:hypothetical protein
MMFPIKTDSAQFSEKTGWPLLIILAKCISGIAGNKTSRCSVVCFVVAAGVCLEEYSGENDPAPQFGNRGRGNP